MRTDPALISCIMPTSNRRHLVAQAIAYFLRQDYERKELIIVDDGTDCIADLVPNDSRLRLIRLERHTPLGAKRNVACHASRGELIAHWDDDDWMAPDRLSRQVAELTASDALVTGARNLLYYRVQAGEAWLYRAPSDTRPWPVGCTLVYRRSVWEAQPFDEVAIGEDSSFVARLPAERVQTSADSSFYVGLLHAGNAAPKNLTDPAWQQCPLDEVAERLGTDRAFYASLRGGRLHSQPVSRPAAAAVAVAAHFDVATGYGSMAEYLCTGMARAGANVAAVPLSLRREGLSAEFQGLPRR
jgi:hypothetical protein